MNNTKIKERPILFSGPMILALLAGSKTMTRRLIRWSEKTVNADGCKLLEASDGGWWPYNCSDGNETPLSCPYGRPGDRLWVKETWAPADYLNGSEREDPQQIAYRATSTILDHGHRDPENYPLDTYGIDFDKICWRPSIFMPRWASRITLEVTGVRVERLHAITREDCIAEGCPKEEWYRVEGGPEKWFSTLWGKINGERAHWNTNPWLWVVSFKAVRK